MYKGVPIKPVKRLIGISEPFIFLANVSTTIRKLAPKKVLIGIRYLLSDPTSNLPKWGITSPIHPIVPAKHIDEAVKIVEQIIATPLNCSTFIPKDLASFSPKDRIFILHLRKIRSNPAIIIAGATKQIFHINFCKASHCPISNSS